MSTGFGKTNSNTQSLYHGIYHVEHQPNNNDTAEVKKEKNKIASRYVFRKLFFVCFFIITYSEPVASVRKLSMKRINSNYMGSMTNTVSLLQTYVVFLKREQKRKKNSISLIFFSFLLDGEMLPLFFGFESKKIKNEKFHFAPEHLRYNSLKKYRTLLILGFMPNSLISCF